MSVEKLTAADRVCLARKQGRPTAQEYIDSIFDEYFPFAGDRVSGEDTSITGGVAFFYDIPVTVIGQQKGRDLEENIKNRFGMPNPQGYRKAIRLMKQAEKFGRPVITFVDTPGAYPGLEAEKMGQGEAIAQSIATMSGLKVPVISVFIGEGGSGGALALGVSDRTLMLENSIFSILSPEGFSSILWKDSSKWKEAAEVMKLTAPELLELGICDVVVPEGGEGAHESKQEVFLAVKRALKKELRGLLKMSADELVKGRYRKLRNVGKAVKDATRY